MLYKAMPTLPVSTLRNQQAEVIATLNNTPVMLTNRGEGAGVLVHPKIWNQMLEQIERYEQLLRHNRIRAEMEAGEVITQEELEAELTKRGML